MGIVILLKSKSLNKSLNKNLNKNLNMDLNKKLNKSVNNNLSKSICRNSISGLYRICIVTLLFACFLLSGCGEPAVMATVTDNDAIKPGTTKKVMDTYAAENPEIPNITIAPGVEATSVIAPIITQVLTGTPTSTSTPTLTPTEALIPSPTPRLNEVTLVAVGDNLIHKKVIDSGLQADGTYNFDHIFEQMKYDFINADIAIINQETILGTEEMEYSGYPRFCSPMEVGDAIRKAGFDVVLHATNHVADRGVAGIENTLAYWDLYPTINILGIHNSHESYSKITVIERNGIKIAMLNYTYGLNGLTLPSDKYYMVNDFNEQNMINDIKKAKEIADFIIVLPHWGNEYKLEEGKYQRLWADFFAEQGVDLIIGSHPHVLQPIKWVTSSSGHKMLVYYSLGNYVSTMDYTDRMLGGMAELTLVKEKGKVNIRSASLTPLVTHYERGTNINLTVYKLADYTQELAQKHYILGDYRGKDFSLEKLQQLSENVVGEWLTKELVPHKELKLESSIIK